MQRAVTVFSQGVNQSVSGTDKVNAIINCHLLTGRIAKPGMGPFSITGQPNAMGGREVGGLANQLAAHLDIENGEDRAFVQNFWKAPRIAGRAGLKAVEMFEAVHQGNIKALWIMATNPAATMPDTDRVREALVRCPFVVVSDVVADTDTLRFARVKLPAAAWGEKSGTVTSSERRISRQRAFLPPAGESRPDWWIVTEVARRMGFAEAFGYRTAAEIFREHAKLTAWANAGRRPLDLQALADLDEASYDALKPVQWPVPTATTDGTPRLFGDGCFATADGRARFVPTPPRLRAEMPRPCRRLVLNTGRVRDHWHTMTRTGKSQRLSRHIAEPFVEIAPDDAHQRGIAAASLVRVRSPRGSILARALVTNAQRAGSVFTPMHWTGSHASNAVVDRLVGPSTDPVSGQPGLKCTAVEIEPAGAAWYGFAVIRTCPGYIPCDYWVIARTRCGLRIELAGLAPLSDPASFAARLLSANRSSLLSYRDTVFERHRFAALAANGVEGLLFLSPEPVGVARDWVADEFDAINGSHASVARLLAGRPAHCLDDGAILCACNAVGIKRIAAAIAAGATTITAVGTATSAGLNCGSCRPEIERVLALGSGALMHRASQLHTQPESIRKAATARTPLPANPSSS
jgi:assimilatory nitrate reductase catalytic subunit